MPSLEWWCSSTTWGSIAMAASSTRNSTYTNPKVLEELRELVQFATPHQAAAVRELLSKGSILAAAASLNISARTLREHLCELRRAAASRGWSPAHDMTKVVPDGFHVKGVSTYYGRDGQPRGQWVKSAKDRDHEIAVLLDAVQRIAEPFDGKSRKAKAPRSTTEELLCVYPMGDPHIGMFAWAKEAGQDFDLNIAERHLVDAVDHLVSLAPAAHTALVINLGDLIHADTKHNTTTAGTTLDVDTRWAKVVGVAIRAMRRCIDLALQKHRVVHVISVPGNHDEHTGLVLALCLEMYYRNQKGRVIVDTSPSPFRYHRFGDCLIGVSHGNATKPERLPGIMACDRKEDWGATKHRYWYCGHVHHDSVKEYPGCIVETFRTLAPSDAWHHASGYRSGQDMKLDVLHEKYGRVNRSVVGISRIWEMER